jgi:hypothetical protein
MPNWSPKYLEAKRVLMAKDSELEALHSEYAKAKAIHDGLSQQVFSPDNPDLKLAESYLQSARLLRSLKADIDSMDIELMKLQDHWVELLKKEQPQPNESLSYKKSN